MDGCLARSLRLAAMIQPFFFSFLSFSLSSFTRGPSDAWPYMYRSCRLLSTYSVAMRGAVDGGDGGRSDCGGMDRCGSDGCIGVRVSDGGSTAMSAVATAVARYAFCDGSDVCVLGGGGRRR